MELFLCPSPVLRASPVLMLPLEQELLLSVAIFRRHLQNCFTDRIFRKVTESQCLANQWSDIDISTQTYICGFPSVGVGFQLPNSNSLLSSEHHRLWHWTVLSVHPWGWNQIENMKNSSSLQIWLCYFIHSHAPSWAWLSDAHRLIAVITSSWVFSVGWQRLWGKSLVGESWR